MAYRKISKLSHPDTASYAVIHKDTETDEFRVRLYKEGKVQPESDYFTDDLADARGTAVAMLESCTKFAPSELF